MAAAAAAKRPRFRDEPSTRFARVPVQVELGGERIESKDLAKIQARLRHLQQQKRAAFDWSTLRILGELLSGADHKTSRVYRSGKTIAHDAGLLDAYQPGRPRPNAKRQTTAAERRVVAAQRRYYASLSELEEAGVIARERHYPQDAWLRENGYQAQCGHHLWPGARGVCRCPWNRGMTRLTIRVRTLADMVLVCVATEARRGPVLVRRPKAANPRAKTLNNDVIRTLVNPSGGAGTAPGDLQGDPDREAVHNDVIRDRTVRITRETEPVPLVRIISPSVSTPSPLSEAKRSAPALCTAAAPGQDDSHPASGMVGKGDPTPSAGRAASAPPTRLPSDESESTGGGKSTIRTAVGGPSGDPVPSAEPTAEELVEARAVVAYYRTAFAVLHVAGEGPRTADVALVVSALRREWSKRDLCQAIAWAADTRSLNHATGRTRLTQIVGTDERVEACALEWRKHGGRPDRDPSEPELERTKLPGPAPTLEELAAKAAKAIAPVRYVRTPEEHAEFVREQIRLGLRDPDPKESQ